MVMDVALPQSTTTDNVETPRTSPSSPNPPGSPFPPDTAPIPAPSHIPPCCPPPLMELAAAQAHPSLIFTVHQARRGKTQRFSFFFFWVLIFTWGQIYQSSH